MSRTHFSAGHAGTCLTLAFFLICSNIVKIGTTFISRTGKLHHLVPTEFTYYIPSLSTGKGHSSIKIYIAVWWWRSFGGTGWECSCSLKAAGMDCTAAGLEVGDQGETPCTHTVVSTAWTGTQSDHWQPLRHRSREVHVLSLGMLHAGDAVKT